MAHRGDPFPVNEAIHLLPLRPSSSGWLALLMVALQHCLDVCSLWPVPSPPETPTRVLTLRPPLRPHVLSVTLPQARTSPAGGVWVGRGEEALSGSLD